MTMAHEKIPLWYNPKVRSVVFQVVTLVLVFLVVAAIIYNTAINLERQGIASGFGFLRSTAGFDISMHLIPYTEQSSYGRAFLVAVLNTLLVSVLGVFCATILGFILGVVRLSHNWLVSKLAAVYVEILRNIPLLLQLFFWYFAVLRTLPSPRQSLSVGDVFFLNIRGLNVPAPVYEPSLVWVGVALLASMAVALGFVRWGRRHQLKTGRQIPYVTIGLGIVLITGMVSFYAAGRPLSWEVPVLRGFNFDGGLVLIPELVALLLALSLYTAAFIAEIVRAGILAISKGQMEAALSLGLTRRQSLRLVIIPQALRVIIPPLTSQFLNLTKNSSLAAAIAYPDLVLIFAGTVLMQTGQAVEVIALTMGVYLTISLVISAGMNLYNRRVALVER